MTEEDKFYRRLVIESTFLGYVVLEKFQRFPPDDELSEYFTMVIKKILDEEAEETHKWWKELAEHGMANERRKGVRDGRADA